MEDLKPPSLCAHGLAPTVIMHFKFLSPAPVHKGNSLQKPQGKDARPHLQIYLLSWEGQILGQRLHAVKVEPLENGVEFARDSLHDLQNPHSSQCIAY